MTSLTMSAVTFQPLLTNISISVVPHRLAPLEKVLKLELGHKIVSVLIHGLHRIINSLRNPCQDVRNSKSNRYYYNEMNFRYIILRRKVKKHQNIQR